MLCPPRRILRRCRRESALYLPRRIVRLRRKENALCPPCRVLRHRRKQSMLCAPRRIPRIRRRQTTLCQVGNEALLRNSLARSGAACLTRLSQAAPSALTLT
jgi:hypothetical protein